MSGDKLIKLIKEHDIRFIDLRYTDTKGKQHHAKCLHAWL